MTKILFISPVGERGGAEAALLNTLRFADRQRFCPLVAVLKDGPLADEVRRLGVRAVVIPTDRFRQLGSTVRAIRALRRLIKHEGVGLVFGNMPMGHVFGALAAVGTGAKAVWFEQGVPDRPDLIGRLASRLPAETIFVSSEAARRAQARLSPKRRIRVVTLGVDLGRFNPDSIPRGRVHRELNLDCASPVVACVARLQRWKGQTLFLQVAAHVAAGHREAHFVLVGGTLFGLEEAYARELRQEAARLLPASHVHFLGHRDDLPEILADVDIVVHSPALPEPFGLVLLEAMAMRVPVVATNAGGPAEIVVDGETGYLVPPGDVEGLAHAITSLLDDPKLRKTMGGAGRERVQARFTAERMVREIEAALEEAVR